ncbi:hypothetical protein D3C78_1817040 [compost metagenome]
MGAVQHREVDRRIAGQLQVHVPVAGEQRHKAEMALVERGRAGNLAGHDDGVVAGDFHGCSSVIQIHAACM